MNTHTPGLNPVAFHAYRELKRIAKDYDLEDELEVPQLVVVGETSAGKSMLVQNFLRFPCSFTSADIATRCPVAYRLIHKSSLPPGQINVIRPSNVTGPSKLAEHLRQVMEDIKTKEPTGFKKEPYEVEVESADYTDFEILDVPGFVTGNPDEKIRTSVEAIVEVYVRNPRFSIVLLKEANQLIHNATGALRVRELCTSSIGKATSLPPRPDYEKHMITIQTKFDGIMSMKNASAVNQRIQSLQDEFGETYFVNMIFDDYSMSGNSFEANREYISALPNLERKKVDSWIEEIDQTATSSKHHSECFNKKYRSLIGIDQVRHQIQNLWTRSFITALPKLRSTLKRRFNEIQQKYDDQLKLFSCHDPEKIRNSYLIYLENFQINIRRYAAYKSEIIHLFPTEHSGKTYKDIEENCKNSWKRYIPLKWRAYRSADELLSSSEGKGLQINAKLVGVRHFQRLNQIFHYLVHTYVPSHITDDDIQSAAGLLYGGIDDYDNLNKAAREWLRKLIMDTFCVGIAWFAQMYAYILDLFKEDVTKYMLAPGRHHHISKHVVFLNAADREFHNIVRTWIRRAILAVRYKCDSISEYAHYDITARLKKLVFSIPTTIKQALFNKNPHHLISSTSDTENEEMNIDDIFKSFPKQSILDQIYGSESYLPHDRDPQTLGHHVEGRKVILELYRASCGAIILETLSQFNSNVVKRIQEYPRSENLFPTSKKRSLKHRIIRMHTNDIKFMANLQVDSIIEKLEDFEDELGALITGQKLIENASYAMTSASLSNTKKAAIDEEYKAAVRAGQDYVRILRRRRKADSGKVPDADALDDRETSRFFRNDNHEHDDVNQARGANDEDDMMLTTDEMTMNLLMNQFYKQHDEEDLWLGLPSHEELRNDTVDAASLAHIYVDSNTMDFSAAMEKASLALKKSPRHDRS